MLCVAYIGSSCCVRWLHCQLPGPTCVLGLRVCSSSFYRRAYMVSWWKQTKVYQAYHSCSSHNSIYVRGN